MSVDTASGLCKVMDGSDVFVTGHQILKIRRHKRKCPEWAKHDKQVQGMLLRSFPKLTTNLKQRQRAGRWVRIIHLYFVLGYTYSQVAEELGENPRTVYKSIYHIQLAASGRRTNGTGVYTRKNRGVTGTILRGTPRESYESRAGR